MVEPVRRARSSLSSWVVFAKLASVFSNSALSRCFFSVADSAKAGPTWIIAAAAAPKPTAMSRRVSDGGAEKETAWIAEHGGKRQGVSDRRSRALRVLAWWQRASGARAWWQSRAATRTCVSMRTKGTPRHPSWKRPRHGHSSMIIIHVDT